jgi:hypothetical protein
MIAPEARLAAPSSLPPAFIVDNGRLGISRTSKPAGFHALDVLGEALGLSGLGAAVGRSRLLGQLAGMHDEKPEFFHSESPVSVLYFHRTDDTVPMPAPWRLLPSPTRLFEQQRQGALLLTPRLQLLPHGIRARDQRDQPETLLQAQPQRAFTVGFTVGHDAAHPVEAERHTLLDGHWGLSAITGIAVAHAHAEWKPITAHAETQEHLFEIIPPILAVPIGWTRWARSCARTGLLLIGPIQRNGRRILMEPGGRHGIGLQGVERDCTKHAVEIGSKQGIKNLPQPVIMERGAREARVEQGDHATLL